jgi:hypothetical protein
MRGAPEAVRLITEPGDLILAPRGRDAARGIGALASGARVVLGDDRPGSRIRLRRRAARLGLEISREYVVLPSWHHATFVVEDHPSTLAWAWANLATIPPGLSHGSFLAEAALRGGRHRLVQALVGTVVPGRAVIARRR